jgi:hypothetical protein
MTDLADVFKIFMTGVVTIGLVTAFGLHADGLAKFIRTAGRASSGVLGVAEHG